MVGFLSLFCLFVQASKSAQNSLSEVGLKGNGSGEASLREVGISNRTEF